MTIDYEEFSRKTLLTLFKNVFGWRRILFSVEAAVSLHIVFHKLSQVPKMTDNNKSHSNDDRIRYVSLASLQYSWPDWDQIGIDRAREEWPFMFQRITPFPGPQIVFFESTPR